MCSSIPQRAALKSDSRTFLLAVLWSLQAPSASARGPLPPMGPETHLSAVEMAYLKSAVFTPDSPMMDALLAPAKSANMDVSDDIWAAVKADTGSAITSVMFGPGSAVEMTMHESLDKLSWCGMA
jgi:hypothetical protein